MCRGRGHLPEDRRRGRVEPERVDVDLLQVGLPGRAQAERSPVSGHGVPVGQPTVGDNVTEVTDAGYPVATAVRPRSTAVRPGSALVVPDVTQLTSSRLTVTAVEAAAVTRDDHRPADDESEVWADFRQTLSRLAVTDLDRTGAGLPVWEVVDLFTAAERCRPLTIEVAPAGSGSAGGGGDGLVEQGLGDHRLPAERDGAGQRGGVGLQPGAGGTELTGAVGEQDRLPVTAGEPAT